MIALLPWLLSFNLRILWPFPSIQASQPLNRPSTKILSLSLSLSVCLSFSLSLSLSFCLSRSLTHTHLSWVTVPFPCTLVETFNLISLVCGNPGTFCFFKHLKILEWKNNKKKKKKIKKKKKKRFWSSRHSSMETNLTSIHEDAASIPGLARQVKDLAWLWCRPAATAPM